MIIAPFIFITYTLCTWSIQAHTNCVWDQFNCSVINRSHQQVENLQQVTYTVSPFQSSILTENLFFRASTLSKYLYFWYETTFGVRLRASDLSTVNTILWKSDNPVSKVDDSWKFSWQFVKIKSMQVGLSGFL